MAAWQESDWSAVSSLVHEWASEVDRRGANSQPVSTAAYNFGLLAEARLAFRGETSPEHDALVHALYSRAMVSIPATTDKARVECAYGQYLSQSNRPGAALIHFQAALTESANIVQYCGAFGIAGAQLVAGNLGLAATYALVAERALERWTQEFHSPPPEVVIGMSTAVNNLAQLWAALEDEDGVTRLWRMEEPAREMLNFQSGSYVLFAMLYLQVGNPSRAEQLLRDGEARLALERRSISESILSPVLFTYECARGYLAADVGARALAETHLSVCEAGVAGRTDRVAGDYVAIGEAYEAIGQDDRARRLFDGAATEALSARASYVTSQRAAYFQTSTVRAPFDGLIRVDVRRCVRTQSPEDAFRATKAIDDVHARQLGELLGRGASSGSEDYARIASMLGDDTAALTFRVMDDETAVIAFSGAEQACALVPIGRRELQSAVDNLLARVSRPASDQATTEEHLRRLSVQLLSPVRSVLQNKAGYVVVPDGPLTLLPASLLYADLESGQPMGLAARVTVLPSFRFALHEEAQTEASTSRRIYALADPIFSQSFTTPLLEQSSSRGRLQYHRGVVSLPRLPETRSEVLSIARLLGGPSSATIALGSQASETALKSEDLSTTEILHLATHGVLGGELPSLDEPALLLSATEADDGILRASEAERLDLSGVRVVVLSACNTGSGQVVSGEGVMGLSRAFIVAGAQFVVVSMWPVASRETELFMVRFYQEYLKDAQPAAALQRTMGAMRGELGHPAYWAPFVVVAGASIGTAS